MKASDFSGDSWGRLVRVAGGYEAFIPRSLPPPGDVGQDGERVAFLHEAHRDARDRA